jgi:hypothetical protein
MKKIKLNSSQIQLLVKENRYQVDEKNKFLSRCIDGRYRNNSKLPALALPGGDLGQLALIIACANDFGLDIDYEKVFQSLIKMIGGIKNFSYHTDSHHGGLALGCGHFTQILKDFVAYNLQKEDIEFLEEKLKFLKKEGVLPTVLEGNHDEGAILIVKGNFGIFPRFIIETDEGKKEVSVFVYQQTLVDKRHRVLVKKLIEDKAVRLFDNLDEEYLYEVLSEEGEIHLLETVNRLASDLPLFEVIFDDSGQFSLKSLK